MVIIDGLGDDPIVAWDGRTPLDKADTPFYDKLKKRGVTGCVSICERDLIPESLSCILRLLGVPRKFMPKNRAFLELLAQGRSLSENEMVLRCNIISLDAEGRMVSFNGMGLTLAEKAEIARKHDELLRNVEFLHLSDYRNLLIMEKQEEVLQVPVPPPHESLGLPVAELLAPWQNVPNGIGDYLRRSSCLLKPYARKGMTYCLYPWGPAARIRLPSFESLNHLTGGVVARAEIVRGIALALGMETPPLFNATADVDTDLTEKLRAARIMLERHPFVLVHFNGADEAAHRHDYQGKADFISRIDHEFLAPLLSAYREPLKLIICGDHVTSSITGKHGYGGVPVLAATLSAPTLELPKLNSYRDILSFIYSC